MNTDKLNEKLLRFAGFDWLNNWGVWRYPDETDADNLSAKTPNFPYDLNACLKWLVPKLNERGLIIRTIGQRKNLIEWWCAIGGKWLAREVTVAKTPELAFCLAIEKLVDNEN